MEISKKNAYEIGLEAGKGLAANDIAAKDADIERLTGKLKIADAHAEECRRLTLNALQEQSRVANLASQREVEYRAALRETREALKKCEEASASRDGGPCGCAACVYMRAVLERHAHLVGEGEPNA